ncbi:alpha/beta fold hydrolase [Luteipulveratus halotolerans]|uniref:AB hydrolase-1 domain-containing protein n=1 Tax=Luteipulveratus halotolerans TaxID=1631356 RepID=A0A0L6CEE9_9MICO|nr:alpha/beta fold hydrolase [Luteipulveratus halotolerans]KNX36054.1 hypothetical protein VV01_01030 [Luteipulveratus halotolerans]
MSTIDYTRKGTGEPVVLIHGIGHRREAWGQVFDRLAASYDVIAIDLPGHGRSPAEPENKHQLEPTVDEIEELFVELGVDRPHVVGNSLGGLLALELGKRGSVRSVTALSPAAFWDVRGRVWAATSLTALKAMAMTPTPVLRLFSDKPLLRKATLWSLYTHPERLDGERALGDALSLRRRKAFFPILKQAPTVRWSGETVVPTTVAWAGQDRILLPYQAKIAQAALPKARHVVVPGVGHVPMEDDPDAIEQVIREQLAAVPAATTATLAS